MCKIDWVNHIRIRIKWKVQQFKPTIRWRRMSGIVTGFNKMSKVIIDGNV